MSDAPEPDRAPTPLARIACLSLDVDGVLTDGRLHYGADGEVLKVFHVRDGAAIRLLQRAGITVAVISGRDAPALRRRLADLDVTYAWLGVGDKGAALRELLEALSVSASAVAHVGDDLPDLPVLRAVGHAVTVADGHPELRRLCHTITEAPGGAGVVAELAERLLRERGDWDRLTDPDRSG